MEILTKLTPAETYLLHENSNCEFKNLLKYTLIDLLVKKVLISEDIEQQSHPRSPVRIMRYVSIGPKFKNYKPRPHELPFLKPFQKSEELQLLFKHLVKVSYENSGSKKSFVFDLLLKNETISESIKNDFFKRLFVNFSLTEKGVFQNSEITNTLMKLEDELPRLIEKDPKAASELLNKINGNVFLLKSFDFELLKKVSEEFDKEMNPTSSYDPSWGCSGCYVYFDTYSDSFDSDYSSVGGDSGCSGGSGCSGCSGCGGCGGCS
ncbi:MAG: hypothetical protein OCD76_17440 [Reichenbachiella sp.]